MVCFKALVIFSHTTRPRKLFENVHKLHFGSNAIRIIRGPWVSARGRTTQFENPERCFVNAAAFRAHQQLLPMRLSKSQTLPLGVNNKARLFRVEAVRSLWKHLVGGLSAPGRGFKSYSRYLLHQKQHRFDAVSFPASYGLHILRVAFSPYLS